MMNLGINHISHLRSLASRLPLRSKSHLSDRGFNRTIWENRSLTAATMVMHWGCAMGMIGLVACSVPNDPSIQFNAIKIARQSLDNEMKIKKTMYMLDRCLMENVATHVIKEINKTYPLIDPNTRYSLMTNALMEVAKVITFNYPDEIREKKLVEYNGIIKQVLDNPNVVPLHNNAIQQNETVANLIKTEIVGFFKRG